MFRQICVLHGADADDAGDLSAVFLRQRRVLRGDDVVRALLCLVDQIDELHQTAVARTKWPAVFAEHHAERVVLQRRFWRNESGAPRDRENLPEVQ